MVVPNRELANTLFFFILNPQSSLQELTNVRNQQMNIKVDIPKSQSMLSSSDSSRESLMHFNASFVAYANRVQKLAK